MQRIFKSEAYRYLSIIFFVLRAYKIWVFEKILKAIESLNGRIECDGEHCQIRVAIFISGLINIVGIKLGLDILKSEKY